MSTKRGRGSFSRVYFPGHSLSPMWVTVWGRRLTHTVAHAGKFKFTTKNAQSPKITGVFLSRLRIRTAHLSLIPTAVLNFPESFLVYNHFWFFLLAFPQSLGRKASDCVLFLPVIGCIIKSVGGNGCPTLSHQSYGQINCEAINEEEKLSSNSRPFLRKTHFLVSGTLFFNNPQNIPQT